MQTYYRELRGWKYELTADYVHEISLAEYPLVPDADITIPFISLHTNGTLTIKERYAWDGPSGPTIDTKNFMRGSLVHDALYQLMRMNKLDADRHRKPADRLLRDLCREDGMSRFRSGYVYRGVRWFAKSYAERPEKPHKIVCVGREE